MEAVGAYFQTLRKALNLSDMDVAAAIRELVPDSKVNPNYIWRIEKGELKSPGMVLLAAFSRVVRGNLEDVGRLLLRSDATAEEGRQVAEVWLERMAVYGDEEVLEAIRETRDET